MPGTRGRTWGSGLLLRWKKFFDLVLAEWREMAAFAELVANNNDFLEVIFPEAFDNES